MNLASLKLVTWLASAGLAGGLAWTAWQHLEQRPLREAELNDRDRVLAALENVKIEEQRDDTIVAYGEVQSAFQNFDWTGKPPPPKVVDDPNAGKPPPPPPKKDMSDLVTVLFMNVDLARAHKSVAFLKYAPTAGVNPADGGHFHLVRVGDALRPPLDRITIETIARGGVTFAFPGEEDLTQTETVSAKTAAESVIVTADEEGVLRAANSDGGEIVRPRGPVAWPRDSMSVGQNRWLIGSDDREDISTNYATILARDVVHRRHRDPRTGKYDGIEIQSVAPGSIAARHGAQDGDVIKSINGHPVTSVSEAVTFAKNNKDRYTRWEVVIENKGKERTVVYETPQDE